MRIALVFPASLLLLGACAGGGAGPATVGLRVTLIGTTGAEVGTASLTESSEGVRIRFQLTGMTPGQHGAHVHAVAKCEPPGFTSAGGHLNPGGKQHGHQNPAGWHLGDVGNITAKADGSVDQMVLVRGVTLAAGPTSVFGPEGASALVVHANPDDEKTDPAGNAGPRIACAVLSR